jgi:hypothetical protein
MTIVFACHGSRQIIRIVRSALIRPGRRLNAPAAVRFIRGFLEGTLS